MITPDAASTYNGAQDTETNAPAPDSAPPAPSGSDGPATDTDSLGCRCGAGPHAELPNRCAAGHATKGNGLALVAGHRSAAFWAAEAEERRELQRVLVEDAGHSLDTAPRALLVAADGLAQAVLVRDSAFARVVESGGPLTSAGRTRRAFAVWTQALDRVERHLRLLGLERQEKPTLTLAEHVARKASA